MSEIKYSVEFSVLFFDIVSYAGMEKYLDTKSKNPFLIIFKLFDSSYANLAFCSCQIHVRGLC